MRKRMLGAVCATGEFSTEDGGRAGILTVNSEQGVLMVRVQCYDDEVAKAHLKSADGKTVMVEIVILE